MVLSPRTGWRGEARAQGEGNARGAQDLTSRMGAGEGRYATPGINASARAHLEAPRQLAALLGAPPGHEAGALSRTDVGWGGPTLTQEPDASARDTVHSPGIPRDGGRADARRGDSALAQGPGASMQSPADPPGVPQDGGWADTWWGGYALAQEPGAPTQSPGNLLGAPRGRSGGRAQGEEVWPQGEEEDKRRKADWGRERHGEGGEAGPQ